MQELYFETIKCEDYEVFNLEYHNKRVINTIGKNLNLQEYINPPSSQLQRCKVIYNEDEIIDVEYFLYKAKEFQSFKIIHNNYISYSKKYLNRSSLDELFAKKENCDDIIIVKNGMITDTTIANIAIFYENIWLTPKNPLLKGTTRARLLEKKEIFEKDITLDMLKKASKIALLNAMIGFYEVKEPKFF